MSRKISDDEIIRSLQKKDDIALALLYEAYADILFKSFIIEFKEVDQQIIQSSVCDSLVAFANYPERYKPEKYALKSYLIMDIKGNILNAIDKETRRKNKIVELSPKHGNTKEEEEIEIENRDVDLLKQQTEEYFKSVFNNPLDEKLAWMIAIEKIRETTAYIGILKIEDLSIEEQEREVKRHKDRIGAQLRRKNWKKFTKKLKEDAIR